MMRDSDYFQVTDFETLQISESVRNWIPPPVAPGKVVTITDLRERWMKRQEEEKRRAEKEREEREAREKAVSERSDEARMENRAADDRRGRERVENRGGSGFRGSKAVTDVEDDDARYGHVDGAVTKMTTARNVDVRKTSGGKQVGGRNRRIDGRRRGGRRGWGGDLSGEKPEVGAEDDVLESNTVGDLDYKKKALQLDDEKINGVQQAVKHNRNFAGGCYSGKGSLHNGRGMEDRVYEHAENGIGGQNVAEKKKGGVLFQEGDEQLTGQTCWYHSRRENQCSDGYWVCKFIRTVPDAEGEKSEQGSEFAEGNMVDTSRKKNDVTVDRVREEATQMDGELSRTINHEDEPRRTWQPWRRRELAMGVTEEVTVEQVKTEDLAVSKDNQRIFIQGSSYQKNDVKLKSHTVESSVEIGDELEASAATDGEANRQGKFRAQSNAVDGRKMYGSGTFEAERSFGSSTMEHPRKEAVQVDSSHKRVINQVGSQLKNYSPTLEHETMEPMEHSSVEIEVKSEAPAVTGRMVDKSDNGNGVWKMYGGGRFKTERSFSPLTGGQVTKEAVHVNIDDDDKMVYQDDMLRKNERDILRSVTVKPVDVASVETEQSETTEVTESGTNSRTKTWGNKVDGRKMHNDFRFKSEKNFGYKGFTNPKKFNGRMKEVQLEKRSLMWVKKGEASVNNTGLED